MVTNTAAGRWTSPFLSNAPHSPVWDTLLNILCLLYQKRSVSLSVLLSAQGI